MPHRGGDHCLTSVCGAPAAPSHAVSPAIGEGPPAGLRSQPVKRLQGMQYPLARVHQLGGRGAEMCEVSRENGPGKSLFPGILRC